MQQSISLNGTWAVAFDPENSGRKKNFHRKPPKGVPVQVPGVWEQVRPGYDGAGWYMRTFELPKEAGGKCVRLRFGAVNYFCQVWVNGLYAGSHEGGYTPFVLDVSGKAVVGKNQLTVRVVDPPRDTAVDGFVSSAPLRQTDIPSWKAGWYHNFGGIWQEVTLLVTEKTFIEDVFVQASCVRRKIAVAVTIMNQGGARAVQLAVTAQPHKGRGESLFTVRRTVRLKRGENTISFSRALTEFTPWDCETPFLYDLEATVLEGQTKIHATTVRFGFRDFEVKNGQFQLNGKRLVLKGYLQQGVYPVTLVFPHNRAMALKEMRLLKDNGYNYIRAHLKPSTKEILDLADEMGLLISAEPPMGWIVPTEKAAARAEREVRELVLRDRNRPSVIFWCLFNELTNEATIKLRRYELMRITHQIDPSRLVVGVSGAWDASGGETDCYRPYEKKVSRIMLAGAYYGATQEGLTKFRTTGKKGVPALISEFGAMEAPMQYKEVLANYTPAQRKKGLEEYAQYQSYYDSLQKIFAKGGMRRIWKNTEAMITEIDKIRGDEARLEVSNIRVNPNWQGYAFCQLADASGEIFGAMDLWRNPKRIFTGITAASRTPWITPFVDPRTVRPGEKLTLQTWLINEDRTGRRYEAVVELKNQSGKTVLCFRKMVTGRTWADRILKETLAAPAAAGKYVIQARLRVAGQEVCRNSMTFTVLPEPAEQTYDVALLDLTGKLKSAFEAHGVQAENTGNNYRESKRVVFIGLAQDSHPVLVPEYLGAARRIVQAGGMLVLLEQSWPMIWWHLLKKPIRQLGMMRNCLYRQDHPVFQGLPGPGIMDYEYLPVEPQFFHNPDDVLANGGQIISGTLCAQVWTTPDVYHWGSCLDVIPLGRGHIVTCTLRLLGNKSPIAGNLLKNLVNYAGSLIRPGHEAKLWAGRCIDEL